jgi:hypothetical protein
MTHPRDDDLSSARGGDFAPAAAQLSELTTFLAQLGRLP